MAKSDTIITLEIDSDAKIVLRWALRYWLINVDDISKDRRHITKARQILVDLKE